MVLVYSWSSMRILPPWHIQNCLFRNDDTFNVGYRTTYPILTLYPLVNIYKSLLFHTPGNLLSIASLWSFLWFPFDFPSARGTNSKKSYFIGLKVRPRRVPSSDLWPSFEFFTFSIGRVKSYHVVRSIWYNKIGHQLCQLQWEYHEHEKKSFLLPISCPVSELNLITNQFKA